MVVDFDVILEEVGQFGRYQKLVVYLLCLPACFMNSFAVAFLFVGFTPDFLCVPDDSAAANDRWNASSSVIDQRILGSTRSTLNWTDSSLFRACSYESMADDDPRGNTTTMRQCSKFVYDQSYFKETVVSEFDLVCDRAIYPKTMLSIHSLVTLFGCLFNSYLQDTFGRKRTFFVVLTANLIGGVSCVFAPNFLTYAILRSFASYSFTGTWNVTYTWALEYVGPSKRSMVTMIMCVIYGVAAVAVGGLAYVCDTWQKLTLAGSVPFVVLYSFACLIDESPRWLLLRGRNREALETVRKIARWEKKTLKEETIRQILGEDVREENTTTMVTDENHSTMTNTAANSTTNDRLTKEQLVQRMEPDETDRTEKKTAASATPRKARIQDLFRTRNLRWKTTLLTYCWVANLLTYLAIAYNMENLKGNLFVTYSLQAAVEIPAGYVIILFLDKYGRIPPLSISMIACGLLLFCAVPLDAFDLNPWFIVSLTLAAKFGITLSFGVLVQLAGESYPTQLRGLGNGFSSFVGTLGSALMPYVVHSAKVYKTLPMILMGITAVTSGLSVLMLPETMGRYMPETVEEAEKGENVGLEALKENWAAMQCCCGRRPTYKAVVVRNATTKKTGNGTVLEMEESEPL